MKRDTFLKAFMVAGTFILVPYKSIANTVRKLRVDKGFMVNSGKDRFDKSISLFEGDTFSTKVSTDDTGGDIYVFESIRVKEGGPNYHYHFAQDEWWYVLQGEFLIKVGDITYKAKAGDSVYGPRMVPHAFAKVGEGEARLLMFFQPAGKMEEFFKKVSQGLAKNMTEEELDKFREEHGFKSVGPALTYSKKF